MRMRKWIKRICLGLFVLAGICGLTWLGFYLHGKSVLSDELAQWRERGIELRLNDTAQAQGDPALERLMADINSVPESYSQVIYRYKYDQANSEDLKEAIAAYADVLPRIHEIANLTPGPWGGEVPVSPTFFDQLELSDRRSSARKVAQLLDAEAANWAEHGALDSASESIATGLTIGRRINEHHDCIAILTVVAIDGMMIELIETLFAQSGVPSESVIAALQRIDYRADVPAMLAGEAEDYLRMSELVSSEPPWRQDAPYALIWRQDAAYALRQYRQVIEAAENSHTKLQDLSFDSDPPVWALFYKRFALPLDGVTMALVTAQTRVNLALSAIHLRRYRDQHGAYPENPSEVEEMPLDPLTGEPFEYERLGEGFVLTSASEFRNELIDWRWEK